MRPSRNLVASTRPLSHGAGNPASIVDDVYGVMLAGPVGEVAPDSERQDMLALRQGM